MYRVYFEKSERKMFVNGEEVKGRCAILTKNSDIEIKDYAVGITYNGYFIKSQAKLISRDIAVIDYDGEYGELVIKREDKKASFDVRVIEQKMLDKETLLTYYYDGNYHIVLEDSEYIVRKDIKEAKDVKIKADNGIYTIQYVSFGKMGLVEYRKCPDFVPLIDVLGDSIETDGDTVTASENICDMLGRIRKSRYTKDKDGHYVSTVKFEYAYKDRYKKDMRGELLRDALYAEDYGYISEKMKEKTDEDVLKDYFNEMHGNSMIRLHFAPLVKDGIITAFNENNEIRTKKLIIEFDSDNKILNFEERGM